jgi:hypothetical protein
MFTLGKATKVQKGSKYVALLFFNLETSRSGRFTPGKYPVPIL